MADKVNALVEDLKTNASLNLEAEQEEKLKALLTGTVEKLRDRRDAAKQVVGQLKTAVENNDNAEIEQVLQKVREGLRQAAQGREQFLDHLDQVLQPEQRARLLLQLVQKAKNADTPVEQLIHNLLVQSEDK